MQSCKWFPTYPNNYRGITVISCLVKLFNSVLNNRLYSFLDCNSIIVKEQIGFQNKSRTSDHMFILRTLIDKHKNISKGRLYSGFVDFRKAFDTVIHPALFFLKLQNIGVGRFFS
jgi:hypothetical protein